MKIPMLLKNLWIYAALGLAIVLSAGVGRGAEIGEKPAMPEMPPGLRECLEKGHKAADQKNFDQAVQEFSSCVKNYPKSAEAHFFLGMAHFLKKDMDKAISELKTSNELNPRGLDATAMLGRIYSLDKQKLPVAQELLERVVSAAPYRHDLRFDLARVYGQQGQMLKSLNQFRSIFADEPNFALYHTACAEMLIGVGEKEEARKHLMKARALAPEAEPPKKLLESLDAGKKEPSSASGDPVKKP